MQTIEHWAMWKEKCALALCAPETRSALRAFAYGRFHKFAATYAHVTNTPDPNALTPPPDEAWYWFETYLRLRNTREGKVYKDWLFARAGGPDGLTLDAIQGGATLLMRDVVRERLRREYSSRWMTALDAPIRMEKGDPVPSLYELLPSPDDTRDEVERRELEAMAVADAREVLLMLSQRERVALLSRELGLSLAHPDVVAAAGCRKSVLCTAYNGALHTLAGHVRSKHPREDRTTLALLTILVFDHLKRNVLEWGKSEKDCAGFFLLRNC